MGTLTKRMKLKLLRKFFTENLRTPLRASVQDFRSLVAALLCEKDIGADELTCLMKQAGFIERRKKRGTFYVAPTDYLFQYAQEKAINLLGLIGSK